MKKLILLILFLAVPAVAEDIYLAQTALGSDTGANAANAHAYTWMNTAGNWDTDVSADTKIGPGDTIHLVGTINITTQLLLIGDGTSGNPITLKFDSGSKIRHPVGFATGMIYGSGVNYFTIEGQNSAPVKTTGPLDTTVPDIECYENGTAGVYPQQVPDTRWLFIEGGTSTGNIIIKNVYFKDLYVRTYNHPSDIVETASGVSVRSGSNVLIQNCRFKNATSGPNIQGNGSPLCTGIVIRDCYITDVSNGIHMGIGTVGTVLENAQILDNRIDHLARWGGVESGGFHNDGIQTVISDEIGGHVKGLTIAYNWIGPNLGLVAGSLNAIIFLAHGNTGSKIYNNFLQTADDCKSANPIISAGTHPAAMTYPGASQALIANNTITQGGRAPNGNPASTAIGASGALLQGNLATLAQSYVDFTLTNSSIIPSFSDYNAFSGAEDDEFGTRDPNAILSTAGWKALGYDTHSTFVNPNINRTTGAIPSNSSARHIAPVQTIFTDDFNHNPRTGTWDAGAFEFPEAGGLVPPTVVSSAINTVGNQFSMVMSEACVFGAGGTGGISVTSTGGVVTLETTPSISGSTITWDITNRLIGQTETLTRAYTQPGNGIEASDDGADLTSFSIVAVTNNSTVAQAATPQFAPPAGGYTSTQNVVITSTTPSNTIRYTINGTDPTSSSILYTGPIATSVNTSYRARAFAGGYFDSLVGSASYQIGDFVITSTWFNSPITAQTGTFVWSFRAVTSVAPNDAAIGLSDNTVSAYSNLATIVRFNASGFIDAYNGTTGGYSALNSFPYVVGQTYDFVVTVNVVAHTYSVTVVQTGGGTPTEIVTNVAFRSPSSGVTELDNLGAIADSGAVTISNMSISAVPIGPVTPIETINVNNLRIGP